jgi:hypothetical protein
MSGEGEQQRSRTRTRTPHSTLPQIVHHSVNLTNQPHTHALPPNTNFLTLVKRELLHKGCKLISLVALLISLVARAPGGKHQFHVDFCFASLGPKLFSEFVHFSIRCVLEH